jgi:hypothetical protein
MGSRRRCSYAAAAVALSSTMAACANWGPPPPETWAPPWGEDDQPDAALHDPDARIAMSLLELLSRDREASNGRIDVSVEDGVVTLLGTVSDPTMRDRAVDLAEGVQGVRAVYDKLSIEARAAELETDHSDSDEP